MTCAGRPAIAPGFEPTDGRLGSTAEENYWEEQEAHQGLLVKRETRLGGVVNRVFDRSTR